MIDPEQEQEQEMDNEVRIEGVDYYMDGGYVVFTAAFHRKRGYCCNSGCRHCPYKEPDSEENAPVT